MSVWEIVQKSKEKSKNNDRTIPQECQKNLLWSGTTVSGQEKIISTKFTILMVNSHYQASYKMYMWIYHALWYVPFILDKFSRIWVSEVLQWPQKDSLCTKYLPDQDQQTPTPEMLQLLRKIASVL